MFDGHGGFWFTDHGVRLDRTSDRTGIHYAKADGSSCEEVIFPLDAPNGIGLSPDGTRLYAAETHTGRVFAWDLSGPGEVARDNPVGHGGHLLAGLPGLQLLDSLAVDGEGWVCVGTLVNGGITSISPDGETIEHTPLPDPLVTNVCFGGADLRTAYATLSGTGALVALDWPRPGLRLHHALRGASQCCAARYSQGQSRTRRSEVEAGGEGSHGHRRAQLPAPLVGGIHRAHGGDRVDGRAERRSSVLRPGQIERVVVELRAHLAASRVGELLVPDLHELALVGATLLDGERLAEEVGHVGDGGPAVGDLPVEHRDLVVGVGRVGPVVEHQVVATEVAVADRGRRLGHPRAQQVLERGLHPFADGERRRRATRPRCARRRAARRRGTADRRRG